MSVAPLTDRLLRRDRWIVGGCLLLITGLAWLWLLRQASFMGATAVGSMNGMSMPATSAPLLEAYGDAALMWFLMMVAMMLPSAAPMILLYARFSRGVKDQGEVLAPTALFAGVYVGVWAVFSLLAAGAQIALIGSGVVSSAGLALGDRRIAGGLFVAAGLYQLTPFKQACLRSCRSPLSFLMRLWRPDWRGTVRLGLFHGTYCLGCCWLLMALLFVGGVMNLAWVAALAVIVLIEKVAPHGERVGRIAGVTALAFGAALIAGIGATR